MADKLTFELVSPERQLASGPADAVTIPGAEGDLTAMPDHSAFLTTLRPGIVTVRDGGSVTEYFVTGGFAEVSGTTVSVLAEESLTRDDLSREWLDERLNEAEKAYEDAAEDRKLIAGQRLLDFRNLIETNTV